MSRDIRELEEICRAVRRDIVTMIHMAGSGHPGGSLSSAELMTGLYFGDVINVDPDNPYWDGRDRFILSKGHVAPVIYSILARGRPRNTSVWTPCAHRDPAKRHASSQN